MKNNISLLPKDKTNDNSTSIERSSKYLKTSMYILEASRQFLQNNDAKRFTTNKIAKIAGVSIGTVYNHFKNKEEILKALAFYELDQDLIKFKEHISQFDNQDLNLIDFFNSSIESTVNYYKDNIQLRKMIYELKKDPEFKAYYHETYEKFNEMIFNVIAKRMESNRTLPIVIISNAIRGVLKFYCEYYSEKFKTEEILNELKTLASSYLKSSLNDH